MSDPYSASTVLLLHMEGVNNSTTFTDSSGLPKVITRYGDTKILTAQSKWGQGSGYFDGVGDFLSVANNGQLNLASDNFTMECWVYLTGYPLVNVSAGNSYYSVTLIGKDVLGAREFSLQLNGTASSFTTFSFAGFSNNSTYIAVSNNLISSTLNTWHYFSAVRSNNLLYLFQNGTLLNPGGTAFSITLQATTVPVTIGSANYDADFKYYLTGYMQDVRVTKGIARYTANFTPPTARLPDPDPVTGRMMSYPIRCDMEYGGGHQIIGTAQRLGANARKRIRLHDRKSGLLIREVWSEPDGSFAFTYLKNAPEAYIVMELDDEANDPWLDPACADRVTPEAMP